MKLLATISQHGLGHLAQAAPVLNALRVLHPELELTLWCGLAREVLQQRITGPFEHRHEPVDVGLIMHDALRVDQAASHAAYRTFHANWPGRVQREADWLHDQAFDRVFSDIACLPLAAAAQAGIASIALCSLNWADIAQRYLSDQPGMLPILDQMRAAYNAADVFLQPTPSMPMPDLIRALPIAPIAARGCNRRQELLQRLALPSETKLAVLGFGGIGYSGKGSLTAIDGLVWLAPDDWQAESRTDLIPFSRTGLSFLDLLTSSDVLITKVGYGSFVEATVQAIPVLYLDRPDWPETPYLAAWLQQNGRALAIDETRLFSSQIADIMHSLWRQPHKSTPDADGAEQAAHHLLARWGR
jgi:hypothetical protein